MGWTYYETYGRVDRLEECRKEFRRNPSWATIIKDALVGSTYYAAMKDTKTNEVWALVVLTEVEGTEFGYKDMDETMEPYYYDCPVEILNLLTPTENENAKNWREKCYANHKK